MTARRDSSEFVDWDEDCGEEYEETIEPDIKKMKTEKDERLDRVKNKVIQDSNAFLESMDLKERLDESDVAISYAASGNLSIKVRCVACKPRKTISLNTTQYSANISNYKRHLSVCQFGKSEEKKDSSEFFDCGEDEETTGPSPKKMKTEKDERLNRVKNKVIQEANSLLELTDFKERVDKSNVAISYADSGNLSIKLQCVVCKPRRVISINSTKYSANIANYKRHLSKCHFEKPPEEKKAQSKRSSISADPLNNLDDVQSQDHSESSGE